MSDDEDYEEDLGGENDNGDEDYQEGSGDDEEEPQRRVKVTVIEHPDLHAPKQLPKRSTRGTRTGEGGLEGDDEFWGQQFWADEEQDDEFEVEAKDDLPDAFDSDFFDSEGDEDNQMPNSDDDKEEKKKKANKYVDMVVKTRKKEAAARAKTKKKKTKNIFDNDDEDDEDYEAEKKPAKKAKKAKEPKAPAPKKPRGKKKKEVDEDELLDDDDEIIGNTDDELDASAAAAAAAERRRSSRASAIQRTAEVEEKEYYRKSKAKSRKPRAKKVVKELTQADRLRMASKMEVQNREALAEFLRFEEERKVVMEKPKNKGKSETYHATDDGLVTLSWRSPLQRDQLIPDCINYLCAPPYAEPEVCAVTGDPARYREPWTLTPFSTAAAFQQIRSTAKRRKRKWADSSVKASKNLDRNT